MSIKLVNSERIESILGSWPSFHDAEILVVVLDRNGPSISLQILICPSISKDESGVRVTQPCWITTLRFYDVDKVQLQAFNYQNVIWSLTLSRIDDERFATGDVEQRIRVEISSVFGL